MPLPSLGMTRSSGMEKISTITATPQSRVATSCSQIDVLVQSGSGVTLYWWLSGLLRTLINGKLHRKWPSSIHHRCRMHQCRIKFSVPYNIKRYVGLSYMATSEPPPPPPKPVSAVSIMGDCSHGQFCFNSVSSTIMSHCRQPCRSTAHSTCWISLASLVVKVVLETTYPVTMKLTRIGQSEKNMESHRWLRRLLSQSPKYPLSRKLLLFDFLRILQLSSFVHLFARIIAQCNTMKRLLCHEQGS